MHTLLLHTRAGSGTREKPLCTRTKPVPANKGTGCGGYGYGLASSEHGFTRVLH